MRHKLSLNGIPPTAGAFNILVLIPHHSHQQKRYEQRLDHQNGSQPNLRAHDIQLIEIRCEIITIIRKTHQVGALLSV